MMERTGLPLLNHVLQRTLRSLCHDTQWVYAVFWRILPRNYPPPKWDTDGGIMDRSKGNKRNWILVWEDGFCDFPACNVGKESVPGASYGSHNQSEDISDSSMQPELFFKMSHEVYNYGEGLMGKVAADNSHKWIYREPLENEISFLSPWHGSLDPHPRTWEAQFKSGIQTIAVVSVREGLLQLGSTRKVIEDLNFVILMQRKFNYLQGIPGVFVPHPSPLPSSKRRAVDGNDSPPRQSDMPCSWLGASDHIALNNIFPRSNSDPYMVGRVLAPSKSFNGILGVKRPSDNELPLSLNTCRDFPFISPGISFAGNATQYDSRQSRQQEGPLPPIIGANPSISLLPSMSSLHNLLSKLPSVTNSETSSAFPSSLSVVNLPNAMQSAFPRLPISPSTSADSPLVMAASVTDHLSPKSPVGPPTSPRRTANQNHGCGVNGSRVAETVQHSQLVGGSGSEDANPTRQSWQHLNNSDYSSPQSSADHNTRKDIGHTVQKDKLSSFLDSFDHEALSDLGIHEDLLENSETYNSFLSEII